MFSFCLLQYNSYHSGKINHIFSCSVYLAVRPQNNEHSWWLAWLVRSVLEFEASFISTFHPIKAVATSHVSRFFNQLDFNDNCTLTNKTNASLASLLAFFATCCLVDILFRELLGRRTRWNAEDQLAMDVAFHPGE